MTKRSLLDSLRDFFGAPAENGGVEEVESVGERAEKELLPSWRDRVPQSAYQRVLAIREQIGALEKASAERGMQTERDELERIKSTHLPRLLQSYIEIPAEHRAEVFRETGKSASFLLCDSLDKMLVRLHDISAQIARGNITTFAENIRFVDLYYDQAKGPFE